MRAGDAPRVLVTGADQHQGLAVIRALGRAGVHVVAAGPHGPCPGLHSRYAAEKARYRSPRHDLAGFLDDIDAAIDRTRPDLILPVVESTLEGLVADRARIESRVPVAAAPNTTLAYALDKRATLTLAQVHGFPVPRWAWGESVDEVLERARHLPPPYALKPRGHGGAMALPPALDFKVQYAADLAELAVLLQPLRGHIARLLVQEYTPGVGRCVASAWADGTPLALFAYERERELPVSGGVSVVRRSIRLDDRLEALTVQLLRAAQWHGVAMVEFKYDRRQDAYTLMEINGRLQASTALCVDAGINLPHLVMRLHLGERPPISSGYRVGLVERWLRGDVAALASAFSPVSRHAPARPRARNVLWQFIRDFGRARRYDEFSFDDWRPALAEAGAAVRELATAVARRYARRSGDALASTARPSAVAQRSMRA